MEMTDLDCVKLSENGSALSAPIDENAETIEINWSHMFAIKDKQVELIAYENREVSFLAEAPSKELHAAIRRIRKKFSSEELAKVHLREESVQ